MAIAERPTTTVAPAFELLAVVSRSGILTEHQLEGVEAKILRGEYPRDPRPLAERLARDKLLTAYQARRMLQNRPDGLVVGRYLILDRIGSGRMGRVYKARHLMMGRTVALKFVSTKKSVSGTRVARFRREMRIVGLLDHPNVVRAYDADQVGDAYYIAMEYVRGQTLDELLKSRGNLPVAEVVYYLAQAAFGLDHAHRRGVVHRDVKPSNLLVSESRRVKVLDLGLGALTGGPAKDGFKTDPGIAVGTMEYLSPEQACSKPVDGRSDVYSLGCAMYHLITGRLPFPGDSSMERLAARITGPCVPIQDVMPGLHPAVARAVGKMLARRPEDRFQTAGEVAEVLRRLVRYKSARQSAPDPGTV